MNTGVCCALHLTAAWDSVFARMRVEERENSVCQIGSSDRLWVEVLFFSAIVEKSKKWVVESIRGVQYAMWLVCSLSLSPRFVCLLSHPQRESSRLSQSRLQCN